MDWLHRTRAAWRIRRSPWRAALDDLPPQLASYWRASAPLEYQGIRTDAFFFVRAAEGLLQFFDVVATSGTACALPSEAADSVWHAWLRMDPIGLERFCRKHFGTVVPHVERADLGSGALLNTLVACTPDGAGRRRAPRRVPLLFALDAGLRMPGGHGYFLRGSTILHTPLDRRGRRRGAPRPHPELAPARTGDGMIETLAWTSMPDTCTDSGGSGGDSGCDSGSSCGSSCGGGCGGGGD